MEFKETFTIVVSILAVIIVIVDIETICSFIKKKRTLNKIYKETKER